MSCAVYCLVNHPEEVDTVVRRVRDAGVATDDIAIVPRRPWKQVGGRPGGPPSTFSDSSCFSSSIWNLSLAPAALWWQWALQCHPGEQNEEDKHTAIPLAQYEARLQRMRG